MDWKAILIGLLTAIMANVIFAALAAGLVIVLGRAIWHKQVRSFFGISPKNGQLPIYLSNITVNPGGTKGTSKLSMGFHGPAITEIEYFFALHFAKKVETKPFYRALRALDPGIAPAQPVVCKIEQSPIPERLGDPQKVNILQAIKEIVHDRTTILVGAPIYNAFTLHLMEKLGSRYEFTRKVDSADENRIHHGIRQRDERGNWMPYIRGPIDDSGERIREYFVIEKLSWIGDYGRSGDRHRQKVFVCAGTCSAATGAAIRLLADRWRDMSEEIGPNDFGLLYEIILENTDQREVHPPAGMFRQVNGYGADRFS